jgi:hypothetical protein
MDCTNRTYAFVYTTDIDEVDFSQVMETSAETVRKSIDESQFLLKWETTYWPTFIEPSGSVSLIWSGNHQQCLNQLTSSFWASTGSII